MTHGLDTSFLVAVEILEHPRHGEARATLRKLLADGDRFALAPQVLAEFVHAVTDPRRFQTPLPMEVALQHSARWWNSAEVDPATPTNEALAFFHEWMRQHQLGRKRVLDTLLAATYRSAGVTSLLTLNARDFTVFGGFTCLGAEAL